MPQLGRISNISKSSTFTALRRFDVDWLRILALGLLIIYHCVVSFQPWAEHIMFIGNDQPLVELWFLMSMINIWRIPIVFMISGMGVRFAIERRDWKQLLQDRTIRILIPFIFGFFFICPIAIFVFKKANGVEFNLFFYAAPFSSLFSSLDHQVREVLLETKYVPNPGHLWFLANIFIYVLLFLPFMIYMKNHPNNFALRFLAALLRRPLGLYLMVLPLMAEAWLINPTNFSVYAMTMHGFWLGLVCFIMGFIFIALKDVFWQSVERSRMWSLMAAFILYLDRILFFQLKVEPNLLIAIESMCWMLAILGFGSLYLNKNSNRLAFFSRAVYPVYIIHIPVQFCISYYLLPLSLSAGLKLILLLVGTFSVSLLVYEYIITRFQLIQPLFGIKLTGGQYQPNQKQ